MRAVAPTRSVLPSGLGRDLALSCVRRAGLRALAAKPVQEEEVHSAELLRAALARELALIELRAEVPEAAVPEEAVRHQLEALLRSHPERGALPPDEDQELLRNLIEFLQPLSEGHLTTDQAEALLEGLHRLAVGVPDFPDPPEIDLGPELGD